MKKTFRFIGIIIVAAIVAAVVTVAVDTLEVFSYRYSFVAVYAATAICVAALLGVFREDGRSAKHTSIKDTARYGQAAIFVGTACLFVGTPQECDELADDLWHYAQQAEARMLTGDETFDVL